MPVMIQQKVCIGACRERKPVTDFYRDASQSDGRMARCKVCVLESRREREERRSAGEVVPRFSLEERKRRSAQAREMHAEGRLGGGLGGRAGRPRKPRIADGVLEYFRQDRNFELILRAYESNLRSKNKRDRLAAAKELVAMEQRDEEVKARLRGQGKSPDDMTAEELHELLEQGLEALLESGDQQIISLLQLPESAVQDIA